MVILKGYVRDGEASTEYEEGMVTSAAIIQGSRITYTSSDGTFYTSADTILNYATCEAARYKTVDYSIPVFATTYDPSGVISGSITRAIDTTTIPEHVFVWDDSKLFMSGILINRILEMRSGIDDGKTAIIEGNTPNSINLGGVSGGTGGGWVQMTASAEWVIRYSHSSVALTDDSIVLMGGYDVDWGGRVNDVWHSLDNGATWHQHTTGTPWWTARNDHSSVAMIDGSIVLMGGRDGSYKNDVWHSLDNGATWHQHTTGNPWWTARMDHSSVVMLDGSIVLMGGRDGSLKNDVWRSTDNGATWTQITASAEWIARTDHSSVALTDDSIVLMGGNISVPPYYKNDVWRSTDNGATWTQMTASAEWGIRCSHSSVALTDDSIVLMGGWNGDTSYNDVWRSTDNGATWTQITASAEWMARIDHSSVALTDDSIVLMGGSPDSWLGFNDVWRYAASGVSGACVITHAVSGDIYNIGGISGESTTHIVFTMWDNATYGRGKSKGK